VSVGTKQKRLSQHAIILCNFSISKQTTYLKVRQDTRQKLLWRKVLEGRIHTLGKLVQSRRRQRITQI
jgi:hypothetical protein